MSETLKIILHTLTLSLANPEEPKTSKWLLKFITSYVIYSTAAFIIVYNIYYEISNNNISKACENGILSLNYGGVTLNYIIFIWHQESFKIIINIMREDTELFKELPEEDQKIVEEYFKKQKLVWKQWFVALIVIILEKIYSGEISGVNERLNRIAKDLEETYSFVELIERCFTLYYELILKLSTFTIPVTLYQLLELVRRREFNLEFTTFIFTGITISAYPCYYSDMLMEKGEDVRLAAYSCGWEARYHRRVRSPLLLILIRTSRPVAVRTMFRTISLIALSEMFQQAYAIFNLMNAAFD